MAEVNNRTEPAEPDAPGSGQGAPQFRRRPLWPDVGRLGLLVVGIILLLVLIVVALLQTEWGRAQVEGIAVNEIRGLLTEEAEFEVRRVEGNFLTGARMLDARLTLENETVAEIDTLTIRYNLLTLFRRTFSASNTYISGLRVWAREDAEGDWNLGKILRPMEVDPDVEPWSIRLGTTTLRHGLAEFHFHNPERDSVLIADGINLQFEDFRSDRDGVRGRVDMLLTTIYPAVVEPVPIDVALTGDFDGVSARVERLVLESERSDLTVVGSIDWSDQFTWDADLIAEPLALADLRQFFDLPLYGTAHARIGSAGDIDDFSATLRADFVEHGSADLRGVISTARVGDVRYAVQGSLSGFDPGHFLGNPDLAARLTGTVDVDLAAPTVETMTGPVEVRLRGSAIGDQQITHADLVGRFDLGRLDFSLDAAVPGAEVVATGTARPFDDVPAYDVRGDLANFDLARLTGDPEQDVAIRRATFRLDGRGFDPETLETSYNIAAQGVRFGEVQLVTARARGTLRRGALAFDAGAVLPDGGGALTGVGTARPFAEPLTFRIDRGTVSDLNLAVITGDPDHASDISGAFTAAGTGTDPATMSLDFSVDLNPSTYAHLTIAAVTAQGTLRAGELSLDLAADLAEAGALTATGTMQPFADPVTYSFTGSIDDLNLAVLMQDPAQESSLTGTYTLTGAGFDPETLVAAFTVDLEDSVFRGQELITGTMEGEFAAGVLTARVEALTPEGLIAFDIRISPFADVPELAITEARFEGLDLSVLLGEPALDTDLRGRIELDLVGLDPATATGTGRIVLEPSRINAARIEGGVIEFTLDAGDVTAMAVLDFDPGEAAFVFAGRPFDEVPTYALDGRLDDVDVVALFSDMPGRSLVTAEFELVGEGFDPETLTARLQLEMEESRLPDAMVDHLVANVALDAGVLRVDTFDLEADFADIEATGQLALFDPAATTDLVVSADIRDAGPLDAFTPTPLVVESGRLDGRFIGEPNQPIAFDGAVSARQVTYGDLGARRLDARANVRFVPGELLPFEGRANIRFDFLALPTFNLRSGEVAIDYIDDELTAIGEVVIDDDRDLAFSTSIEFIDDPLGPYQTRVLVDELTLRIDEERWELLQPAAISVGDGRFLIRNFLLFSNGQQIAADGEIDLQGEQTLLLTIDDVQVEPFVDLIGYDGVSGVLSGVLNLEGTAAAPVLTATVEIEDITSNGDAVGELDASFAYADERMDIRALLTHVEGETFEAAGFLPMSFRLDGVPAEPDPDAPASLVLTSQAFPIAWAEPFIPPRLVTELGGILTTDVTIGGTFANPALDGTVFVEDGRLQLEVTGDAVFEDITLALDLEGNQARIVQARVHDGRGGLLRIEGSINLPDLAVGEMDLLLLPTNFRAIETDTYDGLVVTATRANNLRFQGTITEPVLTGNVTLVSGDIHLTQELIGPDIEEVVLTDAQIQRVEATFGINVVEVDPERAAFVDNLDLDVTVLIERNVWVRSRTDPRFDIELTGDVNAIKPPGAEFALFGSIDVVRGRLEMPTLVRRRFDIGTVEGTHGSLIFNGPIEETLIDVRAGLDAPAGTGTGVAATVYIELFGRLSEEPELTLASDPPMDPSDIACVIATGRPCGEAFNPDIAEDIAVAQLGLLIENIAARQLGLDVVEVRRRPTGELVVTFGAYVDDRIFAAISQPLTEARSGREQTGWTPEVLIEYEIYRWLLLRLEHRNIGGTGGSVFVQFDY